MKQVIIIGSGQIGSRHFQALKKVTIPLSITLIDPSIESLNRAKERYSQMPNGKITHKIRYETSLRNLTPTVDLAIISTSSDVRADAVTNLLSKIKVKYLVLEKMLFQKKSDYKRIGRLLKSTKTKTWVNCPMRINPGLSKINSKLRHKVIHYRAYGGMPVLIGSAIHLIDHMAYLNGQTDYKVDTHLLDRKPLKSKRPGFLEMAGTLVIKFKDGSTGLFSFHPSPEAAPTIIEISSDNFRAIVFESENKALISESQRNWQQQGIKIHMLLQSQLTNILVEELFKKGTCKLPAYEESAKLHLPLLEAITEFVNTHSKKKYGIYPFT